MTNHDAHATLLQKIFVFPVEETEGVSAKITPELRQRLEQTLEHRLPDYLLQIVRQTFGVGTPKVALAEQARQLKISSGQVRARRDTALKRLSSLPTRYPLAQRLQEAGIHFSGLTELLARRDTDARQLPLQELELSRRVEDALLEEGIATIGQLEGYAAREFLRFPNFGRKALKEILEKLESHGLFLRA